jgi:hypothetical protein
MQSDGELFIAYPYVDVDAKVNETLTLTTRLIFKLSDAVTAKINEVRAAVELQTKHDKTDASKHLEGTMMVEGGKPESRNFGENLSVDYKFDDPKITKAGAYRFLGKLGLEKGKTLESIGVGDVLSITINVKE